MFWLYFIIILSIGFGIFILIKNSQKKPVHEPAPEQKFLVVKISNDIDNFQRIFTLEDNQVVVVFKQDQHIETIDQKEFSINNFVQSHQINNKELDFKSYHFYIFNNSVLGNISIKMDKSIRVNDIEYQIPITVNPKGKISLDYIDIPLLFKKLNLFRNKYSYQEFFLDLRLIFEVIVRRGLIQFSYENKISLLLLNYYINDIERHIQTLLDIDLNEIGLKSSKIEFYDFELVNSEENKKLNHIMIQKQKYVMQKYSFLDEKKKELMDKIDFKQKMRINKQDLSEDVKSLI